MSAEEKAATALTSAAAAPAGEVEPDDLKWLREALKAAAVSLAGAISRLEHRCKGGETSEAMLNAALADYRAALGKARATLATPTQPAAGQGAGDGWRTMDSAPPGQEVQVYDPKFGVTNGLLFDGGRWGLAAFNGSTPEGHPTRWRPLTSAPQSDTGEA